MTRFVFAFFVVASLSACAGSNLGECCCAQYVKSSNAFWKASKMSAARCEDLTNSGSKNFRGRCTDNTVCSQ